MADMGIAVFSGDTVGHGKSTGEKAYVQTLECMVNDFDSLCHDAKVYCDDHYEGGIPMFIGGHSLGGMVAPLTCVLHQEMWSGLLLCSPCMDVEWTPTLRVQAFFGNILASLTPKARIVPKIDLKSLNKDPERVKEYEEDPLNYVGPLPTRTANETLKVIFTP